MPLHIQQWAQLRDHRVCGYQRKARDILIDNGQSPAKLNAIPPSSAASSDPILKWDVLELSDIGKQNAVAGDTIVLNLGTALVEADNSSLA